MKLRLIFRRGIADAEGRLAEYKYSTVVVELPSNNQSEVIGGEWLREEKRR